MDGNDTIPLKVIGQYLMQRGFHNCGSRHAGLDMWCTTPKNGPGVCLALSNSNTEPRYVERLDRTLQALAEYDCREVGEIVAAIWAANK